MTRTTQTLLHDIRQNVPTDQVIPLAQELIRIPSENPPGDTREVCRVLIRELESAGFSVETHEIEYGFVNIVATYSFPRPGRTLILNGHVDVVPVGDTRGEWTHDPFGAEIVDGRLYGRGSLDMKGQVAALLVAARSVVAADPPLGGSIVLAAVADEEAGGKRGTGALVQAGRIRGDAVLVAEGSDHGITLAHRGLTSWQLTTHGKAAHASVPERGVNAVEAMADVLVACRSLRLRHTPHPLLGSPSVAIGTTISGGERTNVIPDLCRATLDIRGVPGMTPESVREDLADHFAACGLSDHRRPDIEMIVWGEAGETSPDADIVEMAIKAHEQEFGNTPTLRGERGATDGWWFTNRAGLPTVMALGPGSVERVHCVDEHVEVDLLQRYTRVYADVIARFLSEGSAP